MAHIIRKYLPAEENNHNHAQAGDLFLRSEDLPNTKAVDLSSVDQRIYLDARYSYQGVDINWPGIEVSV